MMEEWNIDCYYIIKTFWSRIYKIPAIKSEAWQIYTCGVCDFNNYNIIVIWMAKINIDIYILLLFFFFWLFHFDALTFKKYTFDTYWYRATETSILSSLVFHITIFWSNWFMICNFFLWFMYSSWFFRGLLVHWMLLLLGWWSEKKSL